MSKSIKLKNNVYLDSKSVSYKRQNLEKTIDDIKAEVTEISKKVRFYNYVTAGSIENFKSYCISSNAPIGTSIFHLTLNGAVSCAILQKASNSYLSFLWFGYAVNAVQYKYLAGTWQVYNL